MSRSLRRRIGTGVLTTALLAAGGSEGFFTAARAQGAAPAPAAPAPVRVVGGSPVELRVLRRPDGVDLVIEGVGASPQLQQTTRGTTWEGRLLTTGATVLRRGPQRISLPEAGLQSISIEGGGTLYRLTVTPTPGFGAPRPVVSADGRNVILSFGAPAQASLQTLTPNLNAPGRVAQPTFVPPLQPRAVAPPVGDMAVGTMMLSNPSYVNVSGPSVTMTLRNAPVKDVMMALSRLGGYGFVYVEDTSAASGGSGKLQNAADRKISISFRGESYGRAINSALLAAGLQGKREGNMILAGPNVLGKSFGPQMSKVYRLNQASANSAADYLASLGASIQKVVTTTTTSTDFATNQSTGGLAVGTPGTTSGQQTVQQQTIQQAQTYGAGVGPLVGLIGTTDSRLGTITLIGDPRLVAIGETYLRQLDLRQRQVALAVKVIDVSLDNAQNIANSFAFRWGNNLIVNDRGQALGAFGSYVPPAFPQSGERFFPGTAFFGVGAQNPSLQYPRDNFFDFLQAQIVSGSSKLLASPTLILQENPSVLREAGTTTSASGGTGTDSGGETLDNYSIDAPIGRRRANEAVVRVGVNVPTEVEANDNSNTGTTTCTVTYSTAGLVLGARIEKIDDNGFVTFSMSPSVSAVERELPAGSGCPPISILRIRRLDTGAVRVRDGQTLVLTGVISDFDRAEVSKWPILGDIPLIGQFFRATGNRREKRELVILVSPRIINDEQGGTYGYGLQGSSAQTRSFVNVNGQPGF